MAALNQSSRKDCTLLMSFWLVWTASRSASFSWPSGRRSTALASRSTVIGIALGPSSVTMSSTASAKLEAGM